MEARYVPYLYSRFIFLFYLFCFIQIQICCLLFVSVVTMWARRSARALALANLSTNAPLHLLKLLISKLFCCFARVFSSFFVCVNTRRVACLRITGLCSHVLTSVGHNHMLLENLLLTTSIPLGDHRPTCVAVICNDGLPPIQLLHLFEVRSSDSVVLRVWVVFYLRRDQAALQLHRVLLIDIS